MKILMTDDDSDDRMFALLAFKKLNMAHSIDFVANGQELIDYLNARVRSEGELPDLILLDLFMPKKSGKEALQEIKSNSKLKHLDVIIFATIISEKDKRYLLNMGAKSLIIKPSNQDELTEIFKGMCNELISEPGWQYTF